MGNAICTNSKGETPKGSKIIDIHSSPGLDYATDITDALEDSRSGVRAELEATKRRNADLQEELKAKKAALQSMSISYRLLKEEDTFMDDKMKKQQRKEKISLKEMETNIQATKAELSQRERGLTKAMERIEDLQARLTTAERDKAELQKEANFNATKVEEMTEIMSKQLSDGTQEILEEKVSLCAHLSSTVEALNDDLIQRDATIQRLQTSTRAYTQLRKNLSELFKRGEGDTNEFPSIDIEETDPDKFAKLILKLLQDTKAAVKRAKEEKAGFVAISANQTIELAEAKAQVDEMSQKIEVYESERETMKRALSVLSKDELDSPTRSARSMFGSFIKRSMASPLAVSPSTSWTTTQDADLAGGISSQSNHRTTLSQSKHNNQEIDNVHLVTIHQLMKKIETLEEQRMATKK